jgi:hypothetical protein
MKFGVEDKNGVWESLTKIYPDPLLICGEKIKKKIT